MEVGTGNYVSNIVSNEGSVFGCYYRVYSS